MGHKCPSELHAYPLGGTFGAVSAEAAKRVLAGWTNVECKDCGLYGWIPPKGWK